MLSDELNINKLEFPVIAQMKIDGERRMIVCVNGEVSLWSRSHKQLVFANHIKKEMKIAWPIFIQYLNYMRDIDTTSLANSSEIEPCKVFLDSEVKDIDRKLSRQKVRSICSRSVNEKQSTDICLWIFDFGGTNMILSERMWTLRYFEEDPQIKALKYIKIVTSHIINSSEELLDLHHLHINGGDEGTMIKQGNGLYIPKRNGMTLKMKNEEECEACIIDADYATGSQQGAVIWILKEESKICDIVFKATHITTVEKRCQYYTQRHKYIGKRVTVLFYSRSDDKVPQHARVKDFV